MLESKEFLCLVTLLLASLLGGSIFSLLRLVFFFLLFLLFCTITVFSYLDEIKLDFEVTFFARFSFCTKVGLLFFILKLRGDARLALLPDAPPVPASGLKLSEVYHDDFVEFQCYKVGLSDLSCMMDDYASSSSFVSLVNS